MLRIKYGFIACLVLLFCSCDSKMVYDQYRSLPDKWHKDSVMEFKFTPPDTLKNYDLFLNLRNNNDYAYSNLLLIVALEYPNGKTVKDTLEYEMAKPNGEFIGTGFSDVKENKLWYKGYDADFRFSEAGEYTTRIQHAMRKNGEVKGIENLEGVMEVGFRIENSN